MTTGLVAMAYGTPRSPEEIEGYYTHIRRGRPPTPEQLADLTGRYRAIGGVSPLADRTRAQVDALGAALDAAEPGGWEVALGNKHAAPFVEDAVAALGPGCERVVGLVLAPHFSRGSVGEYHDRAGAAAAGRDLPYLRIDSWHDLAAWRAAQADRVRAALAALPERTKVLFTAHSLPERVLDGDPYPGELRTSAEAVASLAGLAPWYGWALAWQSAGRTPEPWRGPDVADVIRDLGATGRAEGVLVCPQGFVSDHLEVLYDLDVDARRVVVDRGGAAERQAALTGHPAVMAALAARVLDMARAPA